MHGPDVVLIRTALMVWFDTAVIGCDTVNVLTRAPGASVLGAGGGGGGGAGGGGPTLAGGWKAMIRPTQSAVPAPSP